jgi:hypothetical protein
MTAPVINVRRLTVDTLDSIRSAIAAYAGGPAIARELIQNADDARAGWLEFFFLPDQLIVRNGSIFSDKDFNAICKIGSGSKRADQEAIGTWGTGFLSVYQITDRPEIHSAGKHLVIDPTGSEFPEYLSPVTNFTEFHFPWRFNSTMISERLDADTWNPQRIQNFKQDLAPEIYRALPFLRNLVRITVFEGINQPVKLYEVSRRQMQLETLPGGAVYERASFITYDFRQKDKEKRETWLFYRGTLPGGGFNYRGRIIKDPGFAIGLGPKTNQLGGDLTGQLYNFLPTEIDTGFNFHINGDFFPDANRKSILKGDGSDKSRWNETLIEAIGHLFASNLTHIRDEAGAATNFYRLLPITPNPRQPFLQPITNILREAAAKTPILYTTDKQWSLPNQVRWVDSLKFRALTENYMPGIAPRHSKEFAPVREFVTSLGARDLTISDYLSFLRRTVNEGIQLAFGPEWVNSREKLYPIYDFLVSLPPEYKEQILSELNSVPLCLDQDQKLWTSHSKNAIWLADEQTRKILPERSRWLVDEDLQKRYGKFLELKLSHFGPVQMVEYLREIKATSLGKLITQSHPLINSRMKLKAVCQYLGSRGVFVSAAGSLLGLPLSIDKNSIIQPIGPSLYLADTATRELLAETDLNFVSPEIEAELDYINFLQRAGIPRITPGYLIAILKAYCQKRQTLASAHVVVNSIEKLLRLYRFFITNQKTLTAEDLEQLRRLPIFLTQGENMAPLVGTENLFLPPQAGQPQLSEFSDILRQDLLISEKILDDDIRIFLHRVLSVSPLSPLEYISKFIVPQYALPSLSHGERLHLLRLILQFYPEMKRSGEKGIEVIKLLKKTQLVRCEDDVYRTALEVYFPSEFLDEIFQSGYNRPHSSYGIEKITQDQRRTGNNSDKNSSEWHPIFSELGMQTQPEARDLVRAVNQVINGSLTEKASQQVQRVYSFLNERWIDYSYYYLDLAPLKNLKWLPSEGANAAWHLPKELYPATWRTYIESQAPILPFAQVRREFSDFLGLNFYPRLQDVVNHLLWLCREKQPVKNPIYNYLKDFQDTPEILALKGHAIIYDPTTRRYWRPDQAFFGDYREDFGDYRFYLVGELDGYQSFFRKLGAKEQPHLTNDHVQLLEEIVARMDGKPLDDEHRRLLNNAYVKLARNLPNSKAGSLVPEWLQRLKNSPVVIDGKSLRLCQPDRVFFEDRAGLLEKFPGANIPIAQFSDESAKPLLEKLGVRPLSAVVERKKHRIEGPIHDPLNTEVIRALNPQFARIISHYKKKHPQDWHDPAWLKTVQVYSASLIQVKYELVGLEHPVFGPIENQEVFYQAEETGHKLFINTSVKKRDYEVSMARELSSLLNPTLDRSILMPLLATLLTSGYGASAEQYLDSMEIDRLQSTGETIKGPNNPGGPIGILGEGGDEGGMPLPPTPPSPPAPIPVPKPIPVPPLTQGGGKPPIEPVPGPRMPTPPTPPVIREEPSGPIPQPNPPEKPVVGGGDSGTGGIEGKGKPEEPKPQPPKPPTPPVDGPDEPHPFSGRTKPAVPVIMTDYQELRQRFGGIARRSVSQTELVVSEKQLEARLKLDQAPWHEDEDAPLPTGEKVEEVKFVLSFMMRYEGFLPLTGKAKALVSKQTNSLICKTDYGIDFPLYIDRRTGVLHNEEKLPEFFGSQNIPAGGIVYLRHVHEKTFKLYYKKGKYTVQNVRLAEMVDGHLEYIDVPTMSIPCEIAEFVFRADKRLEDREALFAEAFGKKSVFATLVDIFDKLGPGTKLHQDALFNLLFNIRQVTRFTVFEELHRRPCFIYEGDGFYSFDPTLVLADNAPKPSPPTGPKLPRPTPPEPEPIIYNGPALPRTPTDYNQGFHQIISSLRLLETEPEALEEMLRQLRTGYISFISQLETLFRKYVDKFPGKEPGEGDGNPKSLPEIELARLYLQRLQKNGNDGEAARGFENIIRGLIQRVLSTELLQDQTLFELLGQASFITWENHVRPLLEKIVKQLGNDREFEKAIALLTLDERLNKVDKSLDKKNIEDRKEAYEFYQFCVEGKLEVKDEVDLLLEAIRLDPQLKEARKLLDGRILCVISPAFKEIEKEAATGHLPEAVATFEGMLKQIEAYRPQMFNPNLLDTDIEKARKPLLEIAIAKSKAPNKELAISASLAANRLFLTVAAPGLAKEQAETYFNTLATAGQLLADKGAFFDAIILLAQAFTFKEKTKGVQWKDSQNLKLRQTLAGLYEKVELWDYSYKIRVDLLRLLPDTDKPAEKANLNKAEQMRTQQVYLYAAHRKFLKILQDFTESEPELLLAVGRKNLEELISKEQKLLAYAG